MTTRLDLSAQRAPALLHAVALDLPSETVEHVRLTAGTVLASPQVAAPFVHLPITAVCSVLADLDDDATEIAHVGYEGMVPLGASLCPVPGLERIVVLVSGDALRVPLVRFKELVDTSRAARDAVARFAYAMMLQAGINSVCHRMHRVEQRLAHWLLDVHDRCRNDEFGLTHATISARLGVRRSSVTITAEALRDRGAIDYRRGRIRITDRQRLHAASCTCYGALHEAYDSLGLYVRPASAAVSVGELPQRVDAAYRSA